MALANLRPSHAANRVTRAAENAARVLRSDESQWQTVRAHDVHGLNGHRPRKLKRIQVRVTGRGSYVLHLTSGGVLVRETSDGYVPVYLNEIDSGDLQRIEEELVRLARK